MLAQPPNEEEGDGVDTSGLGWTGNTSETEVGCIKDPAASLRIRGVFGSIRIKQGHPILGWMTYCTASVWMDLFGPNPGLPRPLYSRLFLFHI